MAPRPSSHHHHKQRRREEQILVNMNDTTPDQQPIRCGTKLFFSPVETYVDCFAIGAGKTTICSNIIDKLRPFRRMDITSMGLTYHAFKDENGQTHFVCQMDDALVVANLPNNVSVEVNGETMKGRNTMYYFGACIGVPEDVTKMIEENNKRGGIASQAAYYNAKMATIYRQTATLGKIRGIRDHVLNVILQNHGHYFSDSPDRPTYIHLLYSRHPVVAACQFAFADKMSYTADLPHSWYENWRCDVVIRELLLKHLCNSVKLYVDDLTSAHDTTASTVGTIKSDLFVDFGATLYKMYGKIPYDILYQHVQERGRENEIEHYQNQTEFAKYFNYSLDDELSRRVDEFIIDLTIERISQTCPRLSKPVVQRTLSNLNLTQQECLQYNDATTPVIDCVVGYLKNATPQ